MTRFITLMFSIALVSFMGCETTPEGETDDLDGKLDVWGSGGASTHREAVLQCEAARDAELENAMSTMEMVGANINYSDCLTGLNDAARQVIEYNIQDIGSHMAGQAYQLYTDWREAADALCSVAVDWSDGATGTMSQIVHSDCLAMTERALSDVIDTYVYFEGQDQEERYEIPEDRANQASCYEAQEAALETAVANNEMIQALHQGADCIEASMTGRMGALANGTLMNFPDRDFLEVEGAIRQSLEGAFNAGAGMCSLVSQASDSGGGTMANLYQADCRSDIADLIFDFSGVGLVEVIELDVPGIDAHLEQSGTPRIHPELGLWALYAPGVYIAPHHFNTLDEMYAGIMGSHDAMSLQACTVQTGNIGWDCEGFQGEGCFLHEVSYDATPINRVLDMMIEYDLGTPTPEERSAATATEDNLQYSVTVTQNYGLELYYGTIDGEVYLLLVDLASYSCDA